MPAFAPVESPPPKTAALPVPLGVLSRDERDRWFKEEVQPHESLLKRWLRGKFPKVRDVEDIVHDAYIRVWKRHAARPIDSAKAFLFRVAHNVAIDRIKAGTRSPFVDVGDLDSLPVSAESPGGAEIACRREEIEFLMQAIERLSPRTREVYLLRQFERVSHKEIAERLGIACKTVEAHVGRANRACEQYLRDCGVLEDTES